MSPSAEERLATLEAEKSHDRDFQLEVRQALKKLPGRISRRTLRQIEACQQKHGATCIKKATAEAAETDYKSLVKLLMLCILVGGLIGGAIYQYKNPDKSVISIAQEGSK